MFHIPHMFTLQIQILAISVVTALFPVLSRWGVRQDDAERFRMAQDIGIRIMTISGLLITILAALFPEMIIRILGGYAYAEGVPAMVVLSWCIPVLFLNYLGANLLTAVKKQQTLIYGAVTSLVLNSLLDYLWVPRFGITGASYATVIAYGTQLLIVFALLHTCGRHPVRAGTAILWPFGFSIAGVAGFRFLERFYDMSIVPSVVLRSLIVIAVMTAMLMVQPGAVKEYAVTLVRRRNRTG